MAQLASLYSQAVTANVPTDTLAPKPITLGTTFGTQLTSGEPKGKSQITLNWTIPTENELVTEFLGTATGAAQTLESRFDPLVAGYVVYEITDQAPVGGGSTTLSAAASKDDNVIIVADATNFATGDWIQIAEGSVKQYYKISAVSGTSLTLTGRINELNGFTTAATVKEVTVLQKTETTDYTVDTTTGVFTLVAGQFTASNDVALEYTTTLQDLDHFEIYRVPGSNPVTASAGHSFITRDAVLAFTGVVTVDALVAATSTSYVDTLTAAENGTTWTYYIFAVDNETSPNISEGKFVDVELFPTIPQSLSTQVGENSVTVSWDSVKTAGNNDANTDGYNVYRVDGATFIDSSANKLNVSLIAVGTAGSKVSFVDGSGNSNRVASGTVAFPVNGQSYSYKVESVDSVTGWTVGTQNASSGQSAVTTASK